MNSTNRRIQPTASAGLSPSEVANALGLLTQGVVARQLDYAAGDQFYNVHIREGVGKRMDPLSLSQVPLISSTGAPVPLGQVVDVHGVSQLWWNRRSGPGGPGRSTSWCAGAGLRRC